MIAELERQQQKIPKLQSKTKKQLGRVVSLISAAHQYICSQPLEAPAHALKLCKRRDILKVPKVRMAIALARGAAVSMVCRVGNRATGYDRGAPLYVCEMCVCVGCLLGVVGGQRIRGVLSCEVWGGGGC